MNNKFFLELLESELNYQIHFMVKHIQNLPDIELVKKSKANEWSIVECIEHLNTYGNYYLPLIKKSVEVQQRLDIDRKVKQSIFGMFLNKLIHPKMRFLKFKAHKNHLPNVVTPSLTISNHINQQEELLKLLGSCLEIDLSKNKIPVSVFNSMKLPLGDILEFLILHTTRHYIQINKLCNLSTKYH